MANKICSDTPLAAPPPASPRSPAASDAAPEAWVWFSLRPRRLRIFPRVSLDDLIPSRRRAPAGWFGRFGSKPLEVRDYRFQPRSGENNAHSLRPPAPPRGRRVAAAAMETRLVGTFPTGNGRSRFLFL